MANSFLNQSLSQFSGIPSGLSYIYPTVNNLNAGTYVSEIVDLQEVLKENGTLEAFDFYHQLTDSDGNVTHVRFRYYAKELPDLARSLSHYPQVKTWQDTLGLKEDISVAPKATGSYMRISSRNACVSNASKLTSGVSSTNAPHHKRGSMSSRLSKSGSMSQQTARQTLISEDEGEEFDDFLDEADE